MLAYIYIAISIQMRVQNIVLLTFTLLGGVATGQQRIEVRLVEENKKVVLNNDFKLFIMVLDSTGNDQILDCLINKNTITVPPAPGAILNAVIFQHDHSSCRLVVKKVALNKPMRWEFSIDRKPYARQYLVTPRADDMDTEAVLTLLVQPLPSGQPEEFSVAVSDMKGLRKEVEGLTRKARK